MRGLARLIMRSRWHAAGVAAALQLLSLVLPPVSLASAAAIALVTLRSGAGAGGAVALLAMLLLAAASVGMFERGWLLPAQAAILWLPLWAMALLLRSSRSLNLSVQVVVAFGAGLITVFHLLNADPVAAWSNLLMPLLERLTAQMPEPAAVSLRERVASALPYMSGLAATGGTLGLLLALFIARWWQSVLYNPGGFTGEFVALRPYKALAYVFLVALGVASLGGGALSGYAGNLSLLGLLLYGVTALAVLHHVLATWKFKSLTFIFLYLGIGYAPALLLPLALFGMSDTWIDWRNRRRSPA